jgi:O-glycosyl hydrolase
MGTAVARVWALLFAVVTALALAGPTTANAATTITIDGTHGGRTFDGVGAISGGGGNSRLLIDYPEPQRSQLLDYLFKPGYGADLQLLKLEIGGDANSTDGSEPSIEHVRGTVNCDGGYEWWLAEQAKARNPNIELYGLAWAAPGWIGGGNFWSQDMIDYLMTWLGCARQHGLAIDFLGGWNERGYNKAWYENLHSTLAAKGFGATKVVGADSGWEIADDMVADPTFAKSVDIVGAHYPCHGGDGGDAVSCGTTSNALATGKQLWASENGSQDVNTGTAALIRSITRGYLDAKMTAYLNWPLIAAIYPNLPYATVGLAVAPSPWSGAYRTGKSTWATAQVTQFTKPGWHFIDTASGYLGSSGSYVTLTDGHDYSTIIETTTATAAQPVGFTVTGGLNTSTAHVWTTNLGAGPDFQHTADLTPSGGSYSVTLQPNTIYTISTTTGQGKGAATGPADHGLALPYNDNFDGYATGAEAKYLSDMQGSYEVQPCTGRSGQCLTQMAPIRPIEWQDDSDAFALLGDQDWGNYTVSADVRLAGAGTVELMGRANTQSRPQSHQDAYYFRVGNTGAWSIVSGDTTGTLTTLASGTTTALGTNAWHTLSVTFQGSTITGSVDGHQAGSATDTRWTNGQAGLGVVGYATDQFDNLAVTAGSGSSTRQGPITSGLSGKCAQAGAEVVLADCDGSAAETWTVRNGTLVNSGQCMDVTGQGTANGTLVELWDCNGGSNQLWTQAADGSLRSAQSGKCLDDPAFSTTNGTQLEIWDCNGGANQLWALPPA